MPQELARRFQDGTGSSHDCVAPPHLCCCIQIRIQKVSAPLRIEPSESDPMVKSFFAMPPSVGTVHGRIGLKSYFSDALVF